MIFVLAAAGPGCHQAAVDEGPWVAAALVLQPTPSWGYPAVAAAVGAAVAAGGVAGSQH